MRIDLSSHSPAISGCHGSKSLGHTPPRLQTGQCTFKTAACPGLPHRGRSRTLDLVPSDMTNVFRNSILILILHLTDKIFHPLLRPYLRGQRPTLCHIWLGLALSPDQTRPRFLIFYAMCDGPLNMISSTSSGFASNPYPRETVDLQAGTEGSSTRPPLFS